MRIIAPEAIEAIEAGRVVVGGAAEILCDPPVRVFYGQGEVEIDGHVFVGIDHAGLSESTGGVLGGAAQSDTIRLSGIDPDTLALLDAEAVQGAPVALYRMIADAAGARLLDARVFRRGRVDRIETEETIGGEAVVIVTVEGSARGLGRRGGRLRSDADQRLIDAEDGGHRRLSYAAEKMLYWGGARPARAGGVANGGGLRGMLDETADWIRANS